MAQVAIEKAYLLKAIGGQDVYDDLDRIYKKFKDIAEVKRALNMQMGSVKDSKEYQELAEQLKKVTAEYKQVSAELERLQLKVKELGELNKRQAADAKQATADKIADAKIATEAAKQATEAERQESLKKTAAVAEERRQTAEATKELKQLQLERAKARAQAPGAMPGSYNDIAAQYKATLANYKATVNMQDVAALQQAQQHLMSLKTQLDSFNRSLTEDKVLIGEYTTGVVQAFQKMGLGHLITDQVNSAKGALSTLNAQFDDLLLQLNQMKQAGVGSLDAIERQLIENRQAAMGLQQQLDRVQGELRNMGGVGTQITRAIGEEFKNLKQHFIQFVVGYMGMQQLIGGIHEAVRINYELSDSFADIQNRIHGTEEDVQRLVGSLKELDTRTTIKELVDIAAIVSKKGVVKEEIVGVTQAIDNLMVALNGEMGDAKETVSTLVKLVNVYSEDKHVTADNINAIGGAIARLSNSGVATGAFLVDFAERMGGIRGVTGLTIDKVLGLGAAMQELGQRTEVSSTALSQIVVKLFTDSQRYADILEVTMDEYKSRLESDVLGTFVAVSEKLRGNAAEMEVFFENTTDMQLRGARAISVIGDISGNVDYARKRMQDATIALKDHGITADMAATKQQNFAASVDRVKKAFEMLATSDGVVATLNAFAKAVVLLINLLPTLIKLGATMLAGWISLNLAQIQYNLYFAITNTLTRAGTLLTAAYAAAMGVLTGAVRIATGAMALFNTAISAYGLGTFVAIIGAIAAGVVYLTKSLQGNTAALKENAKELAMRNDIATKANMQVAETVNKIKVLTAVYKDLNASEDVRRKALEDLIAIAPEQFKNLDIEKAKIEDVTAALNKYVESLRAKAQYDAAVAIQTEQSKKDLELKAIEYDLLQKKASGKTGEANLTDAERNYMGFINKNTPFFLSFLKAGSKSPVDDALANVRKAREAIKSEMEVTGKVVADAYKQTLGKEAHYGSTNTNAHEIGDIEKRIEQVKELKQYYDEDSKQYKAYLEELKRLRAEYLAAGGASPQMIEQEIARKQRELAKATDEADIKKLNESIYSKRVLLMKARELFDDDIANHNARGSKLNIGESEAMKLVNSDRDNKITALRTAYMEEDETRKYYNSRLINNERVFQEELQKIEEEAIQRKIKAITGHNPQEEQARAKLNLDLLESRKKYADKFYKDDADKLKSILTDQETASKSKMDNVTEDRLKTDEEKAIAKNEHYLNLIDLYKEFMKQMDLLEKKYHEQSSKNAAERNRVLEDLERKQKDSSGLVDEMHIKKQYKEIEDAFKDEARKVMVAKIEATKNVIADPNSNAGTKKAKIEGLGRQSDLSLLDADDARIDKEVALTERLFSKKQILEETYNEKIDELRDQSLSNEMQRLQLREEAEKRLQDNITAAAMGAIQVGEIIANGLADREAKKDAIDDAKRQKELDWNRRKLESQAQSLKDKDTIERAMALQQEQREREQAEKAKRRALNQMAIEYASAALKIVAANIFRPDAAIVIPIQEGILAATYAAKLAMAAGTPAYGDGGEVPNNGGMFGGSSHSSGGTPFQFRGRAFTAEANELAIINKRSAGSNKVITVTGTPKQIASGINAWGGGVDFAPGWNMLPDTGKGWMAESSQVPQFISAQYARRAGVSPDNVKANSATGAGLADERFIAVHSEIMSLTKHVHKMQVTLDPHQVSGYNNSFGKSVSVSSV